MRAVSVEADPRLSAVAGAAVDWRYAAKVPVTSSADALGWARATFQGAPLSIRLFLTLGWRGLMLEGKPSSDEAHVLGWPIAQTTSQLAVLRRRSRLGIRATLLFVAQPDAVTFSSAMAFDHRLGRIIWAAVAPVHRWAVRVVLGHAPAVVQHYRAPTP